MNRPFAILALAAGLATASFLPFAAETYAQAGMGKGMMGGGCQMMGMMGQGMMGQGAGMAAMADRRLAKLKSELKITDAQTEAWNGFTEAVKGRAETMQSMHKGMMETMQKASAMDRMDAHIKGMEAMVEATKTVKSATEKLYAGLTDAQKKILDKPAGMNCGAM
jgi:LTXXQ motif family protein